MIVPAGAFRGGFAAVATVVLCAAFAGGAAADGNMIRLDIYRPENNGLMNAIPCIITISGDAKGAFCHQVIRAEPNKRLSGGKATVLLGGDRVLCEVNPSNTIRAFTPRALRPDGFTPEAPSWAATSFTPLARPGQTAELGIVPKTRGKAYPGGWLVFQEPHAATRKRE